MAIRNGLIGNPVIAGLLGGRGPVAIQQAANQQIARMQQRPQAARLRAPGAINLPPDNSIGQGMSQLGKALGDIADMKEQSAAKKDLADLYGQTTTVQEPGTGQTASVPRQVTSGDIYKLMGKYINNPTIQKSLGLQAQRLALQEREQRQRQFQTSEREAGQTFTRELEEERLNVKKLKIFSDIQRDILKNSGTNTKATGRVLISGDKHLPIYRTGSGSTANDIVIIDGQRKSITEVQGQIRQLADLDPSTGESKIIATAKEQESRATDNVKVVGNILKEVRQNLDNIGAVGALKSSVNEARGIINDLLPSGVLQKIVDASAGLVTGGEAENKFLSKLPSMSEKLAEAMIRIRQNAKGRAPSVEEIRQIRDLTNLTTFKSSATLLENIKLLEKTLQRDMKIIQEKAKTIGGGSNTTTPQNQNSFGITVPPNYTLD